jgi:hypothetical protein
MRPAANIHRMTKDDREAVINLNRFEDSITGCSAT